MRRLALATTAFTLSAALQAAELPKELKLDYAYYSPTSLVLKRFGWLEESVGPATKVSWVFSQGSNRSLEYLNSGGVDFASTAGLAAVLSRANGSPIKTVYVASRPEWTALVVAKDSPIKTLEDLKGKKIAATKGTDPFLFTLRSLATVGLDKNDVELVHLQHPDGRTALEKGDVDAWAGLDPLLAASQLQAGSRILYRNLDFNSYGVVSVTETFAKEHPQAIEKVLAAYEKAREWARGNPEELAKILSEEAKLPLEVAKLQLQRTDFSNAQPGPEHVAALKAAAPILLEEQLVRRGTDVNAVVDALIEPSFGKQAVAGK
nr:aliphatic sulfonate ABC transporter substrate-binding protein [Pseudomonas flavescens]